MARYPVERPEIGPPPPKPRKKTAAPARTPAAQITPKQCPICRGKLVGKGPDCIKGTSCIIERWRLSRGSYYCCGVVVTTNKTRRESIEISCNRCGTHYVRAVVVRIPKAVCKPKKVKSRKTQRDQLFKQVFDRTIAAGRDLNTLWSKRPR